MDRRILIAAVSIHFVVGAGLVQAAHAQDEGELLFNNSCHTCHTVREGDNRLGPNLHNIIGREAGSLPDYAYSSAMQQSGIVWDEATLDAFIENPEAVVRGNNMKPFSGISSADDRAKIIEHLKAN